MTLPATQCSRPRRRWALMLALGTLMLASPNAPADWLQFRGNDTTSTLSDTTIPTQFADGKNNPWTADLPGKGLSSPIVVGNQVIITAASGPQESRLHVLSFNAKTGKKNWHRQFWATGRTSHHPKTDVASCTPCSDGKRIFALFSTNDCLALDLKGNLLWYRGLTHDYPNAGNSLGMSASLATHDDVVVAQIESDADAFTLGLDANTGQNLWKVDRHRGANWTSPVIHAGRGWVFLQNGKGVAGYDIKSGSKVCEYQTSASPIASCTIVGDLLLVPAKGLTALEIPQEPDKEMTVKWQQRRLSCDTPSPMVVNSLIYCVRIKTGICVVGDLKTGDMLHQVRFKGPVSATPVSNGKLMVVVNEKGLVQVAQTARPVVRTLRENGKDIQKTMFEAPKVLHENQLGNDDTITLGSPALSHNALYLRSRDKLWKIAETK